MKKAWVWILVIGLIVAILIALNYQAKQKAKSLSEIFPDEGTTTANVEYEFVNKNGETTTSTPTSTDNKALTKKLTTAMVSKPAPTATETNSVSTSSKPTTATTAKTTTTVFAVQVASFKEESRAKIVLDALKKKDYPVYITSRDLKEKGTWYRVYVGNFDTKLKADENLAKIKTSYKESFVISFKQ